MVDSNVELGFAVPGRPSDEKVLHSNPKWNEWDGGLLGGKPSLLLPFTEADNEYLLCDKCFNPLTFLLQIYAPRDDISTAFHRSFYVFVCRSSPACIKERSGVRVLRAQCARVNNYYGATPATELKRTGFELSTGLGEEFSPAMSIEVGGGNCDSDSEPEMESNKEAEAREIIVESADKLTQDANSGGDLDAETEQKDFDDIAAWGNTRMRTLLNNKDQTFLRFQDEVADDPDQVLRYNLNPHGSPLWLAESGKPEKTPRCDRCLGRLQFEFQVMPQTLYILRETTLDWGTICVYTCSAGCPPLDQHNHCSEYVWLQHIP